MDAIQYNRQAWNKEVAKKNKWTVPVSSDVIARARKGDWEVILTPTKPVPREWFGDLKGRSLLGLASGGGQQGPVLSAAGAEVTIFDLSPAQLEQDRMVAEREGLSLKTTLGDMRDLSVYKDASFDLIFHPCSNCFAPEILSVWRECFRVLKPGGALLAGFTNPVSFLVDPELDLKGIAQLKYSMPYSDFTSLSEEERARYTSKDEPMVFAHSLQDQIAGQLNAGLVLTDLFEDSWGSSGGSIDKHLPCYLATRAIKSFN